MGIGWIIRHGPLAQKPVTRAQEKERDPVALPKMEETKFAPKESRMSSQRTVKSHLATHPVI